MAVLIPSIPSQHPLFDVHFLKKSQRFLSNSKNAFQALRWVAVQCNDDCNLSSEISDITPTSPAGFDISTRVFNLTESDRSHLVSPWIVKSFFAIHGCNKAILPIMVARCTLRCSKFNACANSLELRNKKLTELETGPEYSQWHQLLISFPNLLSTKLKTRSGQVRMILLCDWLVNPPFRDVRARVKIVRSNNEYSIHD